MKLTLADLAAAQAFIEAVRPIVLTTVTPEMQAPYSAFMKLSGFRYKMDKILSKHDVEVEP